LASFTCIQVSRSYQEARPRLTCLLCSGHSRWTRLQALAAAANVQFDHVKDFGARKAMTDPDFLSKYPMGMVPAFESADGKTHITECSAICDYGGISQAKR